MKDVDYYLLVEFLRNSRRSDRQMGKDLGISQPTVTRRRGILENTVIEEYTAIPKFAHIGFELAAFTLMKTNLNCRRGKEREEALWEMKDWFKDQLNVLVVAQGNGMGWDAICLSFHENYTDYAEFMAKHQSELSNIIVESRSFQMPLRNGAAIKSFSFKDIKPPQSSMERYFRRTV